MRACAQGVGAIAHTLWMVPAGLRFEERAAQRGSQYYWLPRRAGAGSQSESGNIGKLKPRVTQHAHASIEARDNMARAPRRENAGAGGSGGKSEGKSARPKSPEGIRADKPTPEGQKGRGLLGAPPAMCALRALFAGGIGRRPEAIAPPP